MGGQSQEIGAAPTIPGGRGTALQDRSKRLLLAGNMAAAATLGSIHARVLFFLDKIDRAIEEVPEEDRKELLELREALR